ncbi:MAG: hypothetical protein IIC60_08975 [Proteobacteria bacterium]|nr:hypothetical protein [Pseudomonadota bacterium]
MLRKVRRQRSHVIPNYQDANVVREKLLLEIADLKSKLDNVGRYPTQNNLATALTFKEMIYSRKELLVSLSRQKDERNIFGVDQRLQ